MAEYRAIRIYSLSQLANLRDMIYYQNLKLMRMGIEIEKDEIGEYKKDSLIIKIDGKQIVEI